MEDDEGINVHGRPEGVHLKQGADEHPPVAEIFRKSGIAARIAHMEQLIIDWHKSNPTNQRLASIPGIGPITVSSIVATSGHGEPQ